MKLNKKQEWLITGALIALILAGLGYQWVYGTTESSYKRGYWLGFFDYSCLNPSDGEPCSGQYAHQMSDLCSVINAGSDTILSGITNSTACKDGYIDGWAHWCKTDAKDCDTLPQPR